MATAWSASIVKGAQDAVRGTASITTGKSIEIRADLDHFADGEAAFFSNFVGWLTRLPMAQRAALGH